MSASLYYERHDVVRFKDKINEMAVEEVTRGREWDLFGSDCVLGTMHYTRVLEVLTVAVGELYVERTRHTIDFYRRIDIESFKGTLKRLIDKDVITRESRLGKGIKDIESIVRCYVVGLLLQAMAELAAEYDKKG